MSAVNAEALAPGPCEATGGLRCLYVGDIGANTGASAITVYRLAEPDAAALPASVQANRWVYDYPDGEFNAEALLIADDGGVVLITKPDLGRSPHRVYTGRAGGGVLTLRTTFTPPEPEVPFQSTVVGNVVTDASRLRDRVLLLTYDQAMEYLAPTPDADPARFRKLAPPAGLRFRRSGSREGIAYLGAAGLPDRCGFVVASAATVIGGVGCE